MTQYIVGIFAAFAEPAFHASANILDNYLSNKIFVRLTPLIVFSSLVGLAALPIVILLDPPSFVSLRLALILLIVSCIEILYLYPYYWALRHADTSVVASLFSLGKIFIPLFAFLFVGERLTPLQYGGFLALTLSSVLLAIDLQMMRLNRAFVLMLAVSMVLSVQSVLLKYVYEAGVGWGTSIVWMTLLELGIAGFLTLMPKNLADMKRSMPKLRSVGKLLVGVEFLSWAGSFGGSYALYLIPVSVAKGIASMQPIFVLAYALLFARVRPSLFREYLGTTSILKKAILFSLTVIGVLLIA